VNVPSRLVAIPALANRQTIARVPLSQTHGTPAPPRLREVVNYRSYPERFGSRSGHLTPAENVIAWVVMSAIVLYGVACFFTPVVGFESPTSSTLRQFLYGRGCDGCWIGNLLLLSACASLLNSRCRVALLMAAATTALGLAFHLRSAGWRVEGLGAGYYLWQTAVLVVGLGAVLAGYLSGAAFWPPSSHIGRGPTPVGDPQRLTGHALAARLRFPV
jgi:hypothetical protein